MGLAKKVLIADRFGPVADFLYASPQAWREASWVARVLCYAVQLYFDFSGYSDMALGLARMFSLTFPVNFNSPYKAENIIDFWQRWHMTLTRYLNLYLYNPLAMNMSRRRIRSGKKASKRAQKTLGGFAQLIALPMFTTMFLAGVWHGAGMQFILFGLAHAVYLTINHAWRTFVAEDSRWQRAFACAGGCAAYFCLRHRRPDLFSSGERPECVLRDGQPAGTAFWRRAGCVLQLPTRARFASHALDAWGQIALVFLIVWAMPNTQEILDQVEEDERSPSVTGWLRWRPNFVWAAALIGTLAVTLTLMNASTSFLYFQF